MAIITHHVSVSHAIESYVVLFHALTEGGWLVHFFAFYHLSIRLLHCVESEFDTIYLGELLTLTLTNSTHVVYTFLVNRFVQLL